MEKENPSIKTCTFILSFLDSLASNPSRLHFLAAYLGLTVLQLLLGGDPPSRRSQAR